MPVRQIYLSQSMKRSTYALMKTLSTCLLLMFVTTLHSGERRHLLANLSMNEKKELRSSFIKKAPLTRDKFKSRIRQISILGERNSGTTWIHNHLEDCFSHSVYVKEYLTRDKHWFQDPNVAEYTQRNYTLVLAMFRNPYHWLKAMISHPHHASAHINMYWDEFLTTPWTMKRIGLDLNATENSHCQQGFKYKDVISCFEEPVPRELYNHTIHLSEHKPFYEMKQDGSGEPFANMLELRAAKIKNLLDTKSYPTVLDLWTLHYEHLLEKGTKKLLDQVSSITGIPYSCDPVPGQIRRQRPLSKRFVKFVDDHLDWTSELLIGYQQGQGINRTTTSLP